MGSSKEKADVSGWAVMEARDDFHVVIWQMISINNHTVVKLKSLRFVRCLLWRTSVTSISDEFRIRHIRVDRNKAFNKANQVWKCWARQKLRSISMDFRAAIDTHHRRSQQGALSVTWQHSSGASSPKWDVNCDAPLWKLKVKISNNKWMHLQ